jgi:hypothetical protein
MAERLGVPETMAVAAAAAGLRLTDPVRLQDSDWSMVLRCTADGDGTVVVKRYPAAPDGKGAFTGEAAGLALAGLALTGHTGLSPRLIAADPAELVLLMSDLGAAPSMADLLLSRSAGAAQPAAAALLGWARAAGQLAVAAGGRQPDFTALVSRYAAGGPIGGVTAGLRERVLGIAERAALLGVEPAAAEQPALAAELAAVCEVLGPDHYPVFSPGDICPDNNLLTADGPRFVDFESSGFHSVFLDAAYIRMPFSTCWCAFRLPPPLAAEAEAAYRAEVIRLHPGLASDAIWAAGMRRAVAAWTLNSMWWLLGRAVSGDVPLDADRTSPGARQLMRHRLQVLTDQLGQAAEFPVLGSLAGALLAATTSWQVADLPCYPALQGRA